MTSLHNEQAFSQALSDISDHAGLHHNHVGTQCIDVSSMLMKPKLTDISSKHLSAVERALVLFHSICSMLGGC